MWKTVFGWSAAVLVTAVGGSVIQSQINLASISGLGHRIAPGDRLSLTLYDLVHFAPVWTLIVAFGFVLAWPVAGLLSRRWKMRRGLLFPLAGFTAIAVALMMMDALLPVTVMAAARSLGGVLLLALCGALGGWVHLQVATQRQNGRN